MSDVHSKGIELNVASVVGAICTSVFANMVHLVMINSIEGAVSGFLQNRSTSFARVMAYSQIARANSVISACTLACGMITYQQQHMTGQHPMYYDAK